MFSFLTRRNAQSAAPAGQGKAAVVGLGLEQALGSREQGVCSLRGCWDCVCLATPPGPEPGAARSRRFSGAAGAEKGGRSPGTAERRGALRHLPAVTQRSPASPGQSQRRSQRFPGRCCPAPAAAGPGGSAGSASAALSPGAASDEGWLHRENNCSLLHPYSKATGVSFALDPGGGRKRDCPPGERKLQVREFRETDVGFHVPHVLPLKKKIRLFKNKISALLMCCLYLWC